MQKEKAIQQQKKQNIKPDYDKQEKDSVGTNKGQNTTQDYIELSKSIKMEILSPDVKEFLRKNRIRVRKNNKSINGGDCDTKSERSVAASKRSKNQKNFNHNQKKSIES